MLDTGSIPVSGTTLDAGTVYSLPAFFYVPASARFLAFGGFRKFAYALVGISDVTHINSVKCVMLEAKFPSQVGRRT